MTYFGIIGFPLQHSFSAKFFNRKFAEEHLDAQYQLYPLDSVEEFPALCRKHDFTGLNVTLPYKESIIPYLDELDDTAKQIGAVNVICFHNNRLVGYNTDTLGFMDSVRPLLKPWHTQALILGTGGAAKAVRYGLNKLNIPSSFVSRNPERGIPYEQLSEQLIHDNLLIVNCTPLGMYPDISDCPPLPYQFITPQHLVYDVIYNPEQTLFLKKAHEQGAATQNGLLMLQGQAKAAWKIWSES